MAPILTKLKLLLLLLLLCICVLLATAAPSTTTLEIIQRGFTASPSSGSSEISFQPLLSEPTGMFAFGFLRVEPVHLDLAVLHLPSSFPVWRAAPKKLPLWESSTTLSFDGPLVLSSSPDAAVEILWSAISSKGGDRLVLLNSSNLQIQKVGQGQEQPVSVAWQSFDFPSDTLVQSQNFTSTSALFSADQSFSMRLGLNYFALFMEFDGGVQPAMYWKHTALEAKAQIVQGGGPIYARMEPQGFLGMYQEEGARPVDVLSFDTFNRNITALRRLTLENDGNLRAYYWNGSLWTTDFIAITEPCILPTTCGPYGVCDSTGSQPVCSCLDNSRISENKECLPAGSGNFCSSQAEQKDVWVVRRSGVDLANKELLGFEKVKSLEDCEFSCSHNCSCWGVVYNNATSSCYSMEYPVQTVVAAGDQGKFGYFKVKGKPPSKSNGKERRGIGLALLVVGLVALTGVAVYGAYSVWERRRRRTSRSPEDGLSPGPYKDLNTMGSFRSVELSNSDSFRK